MVAQLEIEKPIAPSQQTIEIGKITLMLPIEVDPKPYRSPPTPGNPLWRSIVEPTPLWLPSQK